MSDNESKEYIRLVCDERYGNETVSGALDKDNLFCIEVAFTGASEPTFNGYNESTKSNHQKGKSVKVRVFNVELDSRSVRNRLCWIG